MAGVSVKVTSGARERQIAILESAIEVIAEFGFVGASLRRVADAAGLEKGHLTYYFSAKDDILFEIIDDLHNRFNTAFDEWASVGVGEARLQSIFQGHVELVCLLHKQTRVAYENLRFLSRARHRLVARKRTKYQTRLTEEIDAARVHTEIADISTPFLALTVLGTINWPYQWYSPKGTDTPRRIAELLGERALASLRP